MCSPSVSTTVALPKCFVNFPVEMSANVCFPGKSHSTMDAGFSGGAPTSSGGVLTVCVLSLPKTMCSLGGVPHNWEEGE